LPRVLHLRLPAVNLRVAPNLLVLWLRRRRVLRVSSNRASLSGAEGESPGYPESSCPPAVPSLRLRVAPNPASTTGSMMNPRLSSNFASSACAADESSGTSESCTFLPYARCILNLNPTFHSRFRRLMNCLIQSHSASSCKAETALPTRHRPASTCLVGLFCAGFRQCVLTPAAKIDTLRQGPAV